MVRADGFGASICWAVKIAKEVKTKEKMILISGVILGELV